MRDVCVFLTPTLYDTNLQFVHGLVKNEMQVIRYDVRKQPRTGGYTTAVREHRDVLMKKYRKRLSSSRLCIAFEDSRAGISSARMADVTVVGIGQNHIECETFVALGAHAVSLSVGDCLDRYAVRNYYQVQYLPYVIHLRLIASAKVGYPVSLLDTLAGSVRRREQRRVTTTAKLDVIRGHIVKTGTVEDSNGDTNDDDDDDDNNNDDDDDEGEEALVDLDPSNPRIIPREVLGIRPGSLADVYINNIGMPQDRVKTFHLDTHELEVDVVRMFARLYRMTTPGGEDEQLSGFVTTGGTEGNFTGLWWQRDYLKHRSDRHGAIYRPILLTSDQSHYSVSKCAQQLELDGRLVGTNRFGEIDCDHLSALLDEIAIKEPHNPILMQVNIGTTQTGALDNLPIIHRLLRDKVKSRGGLFSIHVDAALMGAVIPITRPFGDVNIFRDYDVKTLAISGHKFFGSVCICGVCLTTKDFLDECFATKETEVKYLTGIHDMTPSGSRSGFNVLSFHNTLCGLYMHTDANRLRSIVRECYRNVDYFLESLTTLIGPDNIIHPENSLTICFSPRPSDDTMERYTLMPVNLPGAPEMAGVCVLVNVTRKQIDRFLKDYERDLCHPTEERRI